jgi:predicted dehydrogenase
MSDKARSRREFLGATSAAAAGLACSGLALPASARVAGANDRLSVGIVGPGGRGHGLLRSFFDVAKDAQAELTAVCDLWARNRERGAATVKKNSGREPQVFQRLEDMLAVRGLDAVLIATADHAHAQQLVQCLKAGKHVYCEKPFANVLEEANAAIDECRKAEKLVVTLGTQRRSDAHYLAAADLMKAGVLGPVVQVDIQFNAYSPYRWRRDAEVATLKETDVDWKAFLMGRSERKFDPRQYLEFRLFHDFSTGIIDQWMTHHIDTVHMLTGATFPRSAVAHGGTFFWKDHRENGDTVHALLEYPQGFLCTFATTLASAAGSRSCILGQKGTLEFENEWKLWGEDSVKAARTAKPAEAKTIPPKEGVKGDMDHFHLLNWLECVRKGQRQTNCTAEHGYQHAIACILTDRALHSGKRQVFEEKSRTIREG